eukprot:7002651-Prymnesium_polylepis.1
MRHFLGASPHAPIQTADIPGRALAHTHTQRACLELSYPIVASPSRVGRQVRTRRPSPDAPVPDQTHSHIDASMRHSSRPHTHWRARTRACCRAGRASLKSSKSLLPSCARCCGPASHPALWCAGRESAPRDESTT